MAEESRPETEEQPEPATAVRGLVRRASQAALAGALARDGSGRPYVSLVLVAADHDASPVLLLSDLADHTKNLAAEPKAALLFDGTAGREDPLTGPRASLLGEIRAVEDGRLAQRLKRRFVARHPGAQVYADFQDFRVYRMAVESAHLVAGFGRIHWLRAEEILFDAAAHAELAEAEAAIVAHMNQDHGEALGLIAERILGLAVPKTGEDSGCTMTGIDPEGLDLRTAGRLARLDFEAAVGDAAAARAELVRLTERARNLSPSH